MTVTRRCSLSVLSLLGVFAVAPTAAAQAPDPASSAFTRGLAAMKAGDYATGCPALAESHRLDPQPGTLFTLAVCEDRWGHGATAMMRYGDYLLVYDRLDDRQKTKQIERYKIATARHDTIVPEVPQLTLSLPPGAPAGTLVKRDGQTMAFAALGVALPVDPGEHTLVTIAPGGGVWETRITLAKGEKKTVGLELKLAAPAPVVKLPTPRPIPDAGISKRRVATYVSAGIGASGILFGAITGGLMLSKKSAIKGHCTDDGSCNTPTSAATASSARTLANLSTAGWAVALAGVGTAAVLFFTESPRAKASAMREKRPEVARSWHWGASIGSPDARGARIEIGGTW